MTIRKWITENIILPGSDLMLGQSISKYFTFLKKSQWWSLSELEAYQDEKLRNLIQYAYKFIPYYNILFNTLKLKPSDINTRLDLYKIPILTKEIIRNNYQDLISTNINKKKIIRAGSSGSTGEPLQYLITKDSYSFNIASNLRGWNWMGFEFGDKFIKLSQNDRDSIVKKIQDKFTRNKYLFSQQLIDSNFDSILSEIIKYQPKVLRGYPDPLFFLAQYAKRKGVNNITIPLIATTGNILFPDVRSFIEKQFNSKIYDAYSCEGSADFFEAPERGYYYSTMEYAITEILANGNHVGFGQRGRHITTDLHNYAMPFIRYDTQDYLVYERELTSRKKKRNLFAIEEIEGRDSDILITPKGKYLIVHNFTGFFQLKELESIKQFQVVQHFIDKIEIFIVVSENFKQETYNFILNYWNNYIGDGVKVLLNVVDEIELSPSGKRRFLIRNPNIKLNDIIK